jgi:uncharacterized protein (TIGR02147 family)
MPEVYDYTDYRKFLQDCYREENQRNSGFSYRYIADNVGFKSPGHFTKILQRKANISVTLALKFAEFLRLSKKRTLYFQYLVLFNQAKNQKDKKDYFKRMQSFAESKIKIVDSAQYEFYDKWYYTVIREVIAFFPVSDNFKALAAMVVPAITPSEAKGAVKLLEKLGLIEKNEAGHYKQVNALIKSNREVKSVAVNNLIQNMLKLAGDSIDRFPKDERLLSSTTMTVSDKTFQKMCEEIRAFRDRMMNLAREDDTPERSYQFNFQVFPVSKKKEKG